MGKIKIKKDDKVIIIAGEHKGLKVRYSKFFVTKIRFLVEGVNLIKKHAKPSTQNPQGGIIEKEAPIHISNVSLATADGHKTKIGFRFEDGIKVPVFKKK